MKNRMMEGIIAGTMKGGSTAAIKYMKRRYMLCGTYWYQRLIGFNISDFNFSDCWLLVAGGVYS